MQIHIARDGQRLGPFPLEDVNRQVATGSVALTDLAWYEGIPQWIPLSQVPGVIAPGTNRPAAAFSQFTPAATPTMAGGQYAGFWIRFVAYVIDVIILAIPLGIMNVMFGPHRGDSSSGHPGFIVVITLALEIAYFAGLWSSTLQATLGQKICGLRVVRAPDGGQLSFLRGVGRFFGMWLSSIILFIGFIMIAFTERKQGLHDMIASTYVLKD